MEGEGEAGEGRVGDGRARRGRPALPVGTQNVGREAGGTCLGNLVAVGDFNFAKSMDVQVILIRFVKLNVFGNGIGGFSRTLVDFRESWEWQNKASGCLQEESGENL